MGTEEVKEGQKRGVKGGVAEKGESGRNGKMAEMGSGFGGGGESRDTSGCISPLVLSPWFCWGQI